MLLLKGGHLVDPQVGLDAVLDVLVGDDGKICQLGEGIEPAEGCQVVDAAGKYVIPGLVDIHVHFRDPGLEYKETIEGGCRSAAKGGYTDTQAQRNILSNPFKRFEDMQMLHHTKTLGVIQVDESVWKKLTREEKQEIERICDKKLADYYQRFK